MRVDPTRQATCSPWRLPRAPGAASNSPQRLTVAQDSAPLDRPILSRPAARNPELRRVAHLGFSRSADPAPFSPVWLRVAHFPPPAALRWLARRPVAVRRLLGGSRHRLLPRQPPRPQPRQRLGPHPAHGNQNQLFLSDTRTFHDTSSKRGPRERTATRSYGEIWRLIRAVQPRVGEAGAGPPRASWGAISIIPHSISLSSALLNFFSLRYIIPPRLRLQRQHGLIPPGAAKFTPHSGKRTETRPHRLRRAQRPPLLLLPSRGRAELHSGAMHMTQVDASQLPAKKGNAFILAESTG